MRDFVDPADCQSLSQTQILLIVREMSKHFTADEKRKVIAKARYIAIAHRKRA